MSEEEKTKLETLIELLYTDRLSQYGKRELVNYIDKQQKEIKKEKSRIMELAELLDKQENEIKFLKGELEIQEGCSISKDKIREKIKEIESYAFTSKEEKNNKIMQ